MVWTDINKPNLYHLKNALDQNGILFTYNGPVNQELIREFADLIKMKMELTAPSKVVLKTTVIFIEQIQNIMNYSAEKSTDETFGKGAGVCIIGKETDHYFIMCGNLVENNRKKQLIEKLDKIIKMSRDELKTFYKKQRKKNPAPDSKGAGLGFIDMARKAHKPLEYYFNDIDEKHCFFNLKVTV